MRVGSTFLMNQKIKVVLVGCGNVSGSWLKPAAQHPGIEIAGLVDLNETAARKRAAEFGLGGAEIGTDLEAMLDRTGPDAVFDCTVPEARWTVVSAALRRGCHVLAEKPMADSLENARAMIAAARQAGKLYTVMQNRRYDERVRRIRRLLDTGAIGPVTTVNCDFYLAPRFGGFRERMRHVLLLDMAIHTFDAARVICGADPAAVYCREWNPSGSWYEHGASAMAVFEMAGGATFNYRGSWCAPGLSTTWNGEWRVIGECGTVKWNGGDLLQAQATVSTGGPKPEVKEIEIPPCDAPEKAGGHQGCIGEFIRCVQTGAVPETVGTDNIQSLAMVFGAIESAETGQRVEINPTNPN